MEGPQPSPCLSELLSDGTQTGNQVAITGGAEGAVGAWSKHPTHLQGQAVDTGEMEGAGRGQEGAWVPGCLGSSRPYPFCRQGLLLGEERWTSAGAG